MSFLPLPHPSGLCVDRERARIFIASTRNPNQVFEFRPVRARDGTSSNPHASVGQPLVPVRSTFYPGCLYLHDLALINGVLHGNAVGHNAVSRLDPSGSFTLVWWPKCVEKNGARAFECNHIQLNSISGGRSVHDSYYSASADVVSHLRPGHLKYPVDHRGVVFSGKTREPICRELTRPHSVRLHKRLVWVNNSGYGEFGHVDGGRLRVVRRFGSWTRGLSLIGDVAFVGLSRVIPRFARYAPGLEVATARCGVAAVSLRSGEVLGSLEWPIGNQVFAIDWIDRRASLGFPFFVRRRRQRLEPALFYSYSIDGGI
jgi:uncharacterized protein (TIGR03032 family)